jgi:hypothetical protein
MAYILSFVLQIVMNMSEDDPRRMDEIRKYAAIYGRFDCKRKPEKPLTLHEVSRTPPHVFSLGSIWQHLAANLLLKKLLGLPALQKLILAVLFLFDCPHYWFNSR